MALTGMLECLPKQTAAVGRTMKYDTITEYETAIILSIGANDEAANEFPGDQID